VLLVSALMVEHNVSLYIDMRCFVAESLGDRGNKVRGGVESVCLCVREERVRE